MGFGVFSGQHLHLLGETIVKTVDTTTHNFGRGALILGGSVLALLTWASLELEWINGPCIARLFGVSSSEPAPLMAASVERTV